jgi:drug/metabolite transporter (DMT)-like permease
MSGSESNLGFVIGVVLSSLSAISAGIKIKSAESITNAINKNKLLTIHSVFLFLFLFLSIGFLIINLTVIRPNGNLNHGIFDWSYLVIVGIAVIVYTGLVYNYETINSQTESK